jgi:hypothetical protein
MYVLWGDWIGHDWAPKLTGPHSSSGSPNITSNMTNFCTIYHVNVNHKDEILKMKCFKKMISGLSKTFYCFESSTLPSMKFIQITFKNSNVPTSQKSEFDSITNTNRLTLFIEIIRVYSEN